MTANRIDNQDMQYENARDMDVTANFDGVSFPGAKFKVHGADMDYRPVIDVVAIPKATWSLTNCYF
eukprot:COSAG02_NODE_9890_length_2082_cov_1.607665_3_plen_66_part_00